MLGSMMSRIIPEARIITRETFDAEYPSYWWYKEGDVIINCIGVIKPYCHNVERAIKINSLFPQTLPEGSIQIATDCVYLGTKGKYVESDLHDADDTYGKTKSLGEASGVHNLRCSIIGPEIKTHSSLLDWFLAQEGEVNGFTNHLWNGLTTYHFAKIVKAVIEKNIPLQYMQHIVPADVVTKAELLKIIAKVYGKKIKINEVEADVAVDRTLATSHKAMNRKLWKAAGYDEIPTIEQMVKEMKEETSNSLPF